MKSLLGLVCLLWIPITVEAASIGIFSTPDCTSCNLSVPVNGSGTLYVNALPEPYSPITGAEFRIVGLPPEWFVLRSIPNPEINLRIGDPLGAGTNVGFAAGQPGNCVNLFTIEFVATSLRNDLEITHHTTPSRPDRSCPMIVFDCVCFPVVCVGGGQMFVNSNRECLVGVHPTTWAGMKQLYQ